MNRIVGLRDFFNKINDLGPCNGVFPFRGQVCIWERKYGFRDVKAQKRKRYMNLIY